MTRLKDKVTDVLSESRTLIIGTQILLGFQFRSVLEKGTDALTLSLRVVKVASLGLILLTIALLITPSAYHRIVEHGEETEHFQRFASRLMNMALLPFALVLGLEFYVAADQVLETRWARVAGLGVLIIALSFWYGFEFFIRWQRSGGIRRRRKMKASDGDKKDASLTGQEPHAGAGAQAEKALNMDAQNEVGTDAQGASVETISTTGPDATADVPNVPNAHAATDVATRTNTPEAPGTSPEIHAPPAPEETAAAATAQTSEAGGAGKEEPKKDEAAQEEERGTKVTDKINHLLTEARMILPGAQALLGFQLVSIFMEGFERLPVTSKAVHLASLGLIGLTTILLMMPAAYHRIVEQGEDTEHFHAIASRILIIALVPLALGICGEVYVVVYRLIESTLLSIVFAVIVLAIFYELWFGMTFDRRAQRRAAS